MLGVGLSKVLLSTHDDDWAKQFEITKKELTVALGDNIVEIYHIGSTAIKGIVAKPILDVAVTVKDIQSLNITNLASVGYEYWEQRHNVPGRCLFIKRRDVNTFTHHIHCYSENNESLKDTVLFCKFLNDNPEYAKQYNDLKMDLSLKYADDRNAYSDGKDKFINMILDLANNTNC